MQSGVSLLYVGPDQVLTRMDCEQWFHPCFGLVSANGQRSPARPLIDSLRPSGAARVSQRASSRATTVLYETPDWSCSIDPCAAMDQNRTGQFIKCRERGRHFSLCRTLVVCQTDVANFETLQSVVLQKTTSRQIEPATNVVPIQLRRLEQADDRANSAVDNPLYPPDDERASPRRKRSWSVSWNTRRVDRMIAKGSLR